LSLFLVFLLALSVVCGFHASSPRPSNRVASSLKSSSFDRAVAQARETLGDVDDLMIIFKVAFALREKEVEKVLRQKEVDMVLREKEVEKALREKDVEQSLREKDMEKTLREKELQNNIDNQKAYFEERISTIIQRYAF
jgi:hypothetical protein